MQRALLLPLLLPRWVRTQRPDVCSWDGLDGQKLTGTWWGNFYTICHSTCKPGIKPALWRMRQIFRVNCRVRQPDQTRPNQKMYNCRWVTKLTVALRHTIEFMFCKSVIEILIFSGHHENFSHAGNWTTQLSSQPYHLSLLTPPLSVWEVGPVTQAILR